MTFGGPASAGPPSSILTSHRSVGQIIPIPRYPIQVTSQSNRRCFRVNSPSADFFSRATVTVSCIGNFHCTGGQLEGGREPHAGIKVHREADMEKSIDPVCGMSVEEEGSLQ